MAGDPTGRISHIPEMHRGQSWKIAVRCATTGAGTLASSFENGDTIDGVTLATGDRILIKNQASGSENGIYTVNASGAPTRAHDMDQDGTTAVPAAEVFGAVIWVVSGTTNAATLWYCTNTGTITLGSTSLTFSQFSSGGTSFGTPALTYSTTNSAGAASTAIRTDATVAVFDATAPTTQAFGDSAATGSAAFAARRDHKHGEPTAAVTTSGHTMTTGRLLGRTTASTGAIEEITAGSGLTLSAGTLSATGGGSGGVAVYPLDSYALDGTYGDHFTAGSLSGSWTRRNYTSGAETYAQGPNGTYLRISNSGRANGDGYFRTAPGGDWTFAMKFVIRNGIEINWGLNVVDTNGTGLWMISVYSSHTPWAPLLATVTTYTSYGGSYVQPGIAGSSPNVTVFNAFYPLDRLYWMSLRKSGTSYYCATSFDGDLWSPESAAITFSGTVDRVGMGNGPLGTASNTNGYVDVDWFNKIA